MKNKILIAAAMAFSVSMYAQQTNKMSEAHRHVGNNSYSLINPQWKTAYQAEIVAYMAKTADDNTCPADGSCMLLQNKAIAISANLPTYTIMANGALLTPHGTMIGLGSGIFKSKKGEGIDMQGNPTGIAAPESVKEQAAL